MQLNIFRDWLITNKITEEVEEEFLITYDDKIVIPVHDQDGHFLFNKYRRSPLSDEGPKYTYDRGGKVTLYAWHKAKNYDTILITEGEKDCLVAWSHNIPAVTSTGGALSFQKEWADLFKDKEVIICYDNDYAGADGTVKTLDFIPHAKVLFIPDMPNVKDISDYVNVGGNLHELLKTAKNFGSLEEVTEDKNRRIASFQSVFFHDAYIKAHTKIVPKNVPRKTFDNDRVTNAKQYPMDELITFKQGKAKCLWHAEKSGSLHYYQQDNRAYCFGCGKRYDAIDAYMKLNNVSFSKAVNELNK